jgi:hypothetical protein
MEAFLTSLAVPHPVPKKSSEPAPDDGSAMSHDPFLSFRLASGSPTTRPELSPRWNNKCFLQYDWSTLPLTEGR